MLDVDGVLLSNAVPWTRNLKSDLGISPADLQRTFFKKHWHKIVVGNGDIMPLLGLALEQMGSVVSAERLLDYWFKNDATVVSGVLEDVAFLKDKGWRAFLATNQEHVRAHYLMEGLGLAVHFDGIAYSAGLGARKPHSEFFARATAMTGADASEHVFVDDTDANVRAARKSGWVAHHWEPTMRLRTVAIL